MRRPMTAALLVFAVSAAAGSAACSATSKDGKRDEPRSEGKASPAGEGMCKEHGVLEAICTRCNPKLIPVFQAKGDWCKEHEFPASVCPICHPERGGKPAADVKSDGAPADGTKVRLRKKDTAAWAGLETVKAVLRPGGAAVVAPARLSYDGTRLAQINARSPGVVRTLKVDVGSKVKKGDVLAVIDSAAVGADRARLTAAKSRVAVAEQNHRREKSLVEEGIAAQKNTLATQQELDAARSEYGALAAALSVLGGGGGGGAGGYVLTSPLDGVVTERKVTIGKLVNIEEVLYEVVDTSSMWADLDVAEVDLPAIAPEQTVTLVFDGLQERKLSGKITYVAPAVDLHTRSARVRVPLPNPDGTLRANMFGEARIAVEGKRPTVMVPRAAVQRAKDVHLVFVRLAEDQFEARRVELGVPEEGLIELKKGVRPGEDVVTQGSFLLKTETLKESIGAGCCDGD